VRHHLAPVSRPESVAGNIGEGSCRDRAAANGGNAQPESQLQGDLLGIGRENGERSRTDVTETDHANVNVSHVKGYDSEVGGFPASSNLRRRWLKLLPLAAGVRLLPAQTVRPQDPVPLPSTGEDTHLPNGKLQRDEILKSEYDQNLRDARDLMELTKSFELELEKSDRFVLSLGLLKKLDDVDRITKRIRNRMRH